MSRELLIEKMARAIWNARCEHECDDEFWQSHWPHDFQTLKREACAALDALPAAGLVIVPRELPEESELVGALWNGNIRIMWRKMVQHTMGEVDDLGAAAFAKEI